MVVSEIRSMAFSSLPELVKQAETAVQGISVELKPIAFQEVLRHLLSGQPSAINPSSSAAPRVAQTTDAGEFDLAEYLRTHTKSAERVLGVMYALGAYDVPTTASAITDAFRRNRQDVPGNLPREMKVLIKSGFAEDDGSSGQGRGRLYRLKAKGLQRVESSSQETT
jgi:hypothetical protein